MFRGLTRDTPGFPEAAQEAVLIEAGVPPRAIYKNLKDAAQSLRSNNRIVVAGFMALGEDRDEILEAIRLVHARKPGCAVMDAVTKGLSSNRLQCEKLVTAAIADMANAKRGPVDRRGQMPWDQITKLWYEKTLRTKDVMKRINHGRRGRARLSYTTIWRKLGKRDVITGRPSKT